MLTIYISIFLLLNISIYFLTKKYIRLKHQVVFILFLIIVIKSLCNIFENDLTTYSLLQLSKFSTSIPIFVFLIRLIRKEVKLKCQYKYPFFKFIWDDSFDFPLLFSLLIFCYQLFMLLTSDYLTLNL